MRSSRRFRELSRTGYIHPSCNVTLRWSQTRKLMWLGKSSLRSRKLCWMEMRCSWNMITVKIFFRFVLLYLSPLCAVIVEKNCWRQKVKEVIWIKNGQRVRWWWTAQDKLGFVACNLRNTWKQKKTNIDLFCFLTCPCVCCWQVLVKWSMKFSNL